MLLIRMFNHDSILNSSIFRHTQETRENTHTYRGFGMSGSSPALYVLYQGPVKVEPSIFKQLECHIELLI